MFLLFTAHARFSIRKKKRQNPWEMAEFLQTMNLFRKLTHHRFHQRTRLGIVVRNVSVGRRPTNLATLYSLPRHSSIPSTGKNACFALYAYSSLIYLFVAKPSSSSSARDEVFPRFLSWSMTRDSASRFYARLVSHTCARHCDIRDYLGLMEVCGRYAGTRALVGSPLLIETVPFY